MSEELCVWEHHNFLPESSISIWLKPLKDFYSPSLLWWQETRLLILFILCWFYKLTCNKCMYNVCLAWHFMLMLLRICILSVSAKTFWAWRTRESEMTVWILSWQPLASISSSPSWPVVGQVVDQKTMPYICDAELQTKERDLGILVRYPLASPSEHRVADRKVDMEKWVVDGRDPLFFDRHAVGTVTLTLMFMIHNKKGHLPKTH